MDSIRLGELCAATSLFTDLGTGQPVEHGLRTCLVSMRLADGLGYDADTRRETFFVSLLRFLGCTADTHLAADIAGGNDLGFLSEMAPVTMGSQPEELIRLIDAIVGLVGVRNGARAVIGAITDTGSKQRLLEAHCEVAERLSDDMGLPTTVSRALGKAYARWDGLGVPSGVGGESIPASVRVSVVARDLELWARDVGSDSARSVLQRRSGRAYDPTVVAAALDLGVDRLRRSDGDLWEAVLDLEPGPRVMLTGRAAVDRAMSALGDFADLKVPAFSGHARRVRRIVDAAGDTVGLSTWEARTLGLAASVHDIGVVAAPARVWDGSGGSPAEIEHARAHPMWSRRLLGRVSGLGDVAALTGSHHERADGSGHPLGLHGDLGRSAGVLACAELYDESTRRLGDPQAAAEELARLAGRGLDPTDVRSVLHAAEVSTPTLAVDRPAGLTEREVDVLRLLARGHTNRGIATRLGISTRTVGSHVEHIYTKAGVRSRAAATLFASEHGLT